MLKYAVLLAFAAVGLAQQQVSVTFGVLFRCTELVDIERHGNNVVVLVGVSIHHVRPAYAVTDTTCSWPDNLRGRLHLLSDQPL